MDWCVIVVVSFFLIVVIWVVINIGVVVIWQLQDVLGCEVQVIMFWRLLMN